jgi:hypothetical protein
MTIIARRALALPRPLSPSPFACGPAEPYGADAGSQPNLNCGTNSFRKKLENHTASVALHFASQALDAVQMAVVGRPILAIVVTDLPKTGWRRFGTGTRFMRERQSPQNQAD